MKMKNKLHFVPMVVIIILALGVTDSVQTTTAKPTMWTTGRPGLNLNGKMFTLSINSGISFYSPISPPWTTSSPTSGVSVCLRCINEFQQTSPSIFTLSPSRSPLTLDITSYKLTDAYAHDYVILKPSTRFLSNSLSDIWTTVCLTVDSRKNLTQVFSGLNMSIRKFLPKPYVWSGESVIDFSGFYGQLTDVQVWDYPLSYGEVYNYMTRGVDGSHQGSVLSWSNVGYSIRGNVLLEDIYNW